MKLRKEFIVGIIATIGICGLVLGFFYLKGLELWKDRTSYYAVYDNSGGITNGRPITLNGLKVGSIVDVSFNPDNLSSVIVAMEISDPSVLKIPIGTMAKLNSDLLAGPYVELQWNDTNVFYQSGDTLWSEVSKDIEDQINERLIPLEKKTNELISTADSAIQTIEAIFSRNTDNLDESFEGIRRAILNFESVSLRIDTLIKSEKSRISSVLVNVESITKNLKKNNEAIENTVTNISQITDSLAMVDFVGTINNVKTTIEQVNLLIDDVHHGDGTISHLIQDTLMYNNFNLMLDEATRLVENIKVHPNRYLQFSVFGGKEKSRLDARDEKVLKKFIKDSLRN
ncbi:MAG: MlaD family protein [Flavobacteriales bacterium]|jgi:phospholipid/cholesterol/gamma-HCH transport system substrate-binding protein|nr:MCE family protein [Flavobacterium sp.]MDG2370768.1 MlaD family protein [Flavobacteriales bacterium]